MHTVPIREGKRMAVKKKKKIYKNSKKKKKELVYYILIFREKYPQNFLHRLKSLDAIKTRYLES